MSLGGDPMGQLKHEEPSGDVTLSGGGQPPSQPDPMFQGFGGYPPPDGPNVLHQPDHVNESIKTYNFILVVWAEQKMFSMFNNMFLL